jgi:hypothetical protein
MKRLLTMIALTALLFCTALPAASQSAGFDLLHTASGASVDLSSLGLGVVPLQGVQIMPALGNTDTIMHRDASGPGNVPIHVYALFMKSTSPVTFHGTSCDVYITINDSNGMISTSVLPQPDSLPASAGTITINTNGTFSASFPVTADVILAKAGTSVTNPANWVGHEPAPAKVISTTNSPWSKTPPSLYPSSPNFPSGGFYPEPPIHTSGPHPVVPASCAITQPDQTIVCAAAE